MKSFFCLFVCQFESYERPCSAHAGCIGADRILLMAHDTLLLRKIAIDLLPALKHKHSKVFSNVLFILFSGLASLFFFTK